YFDHPPAIAWLIALVDHGRRDVLLVRAGPLLCGAGATFALAGFAARVSAMRAAGAIAALLLNLTPLIAIAFTVATPDAPYLLAWSLALYAGHRALADDRLLDWLLLGVAVGLAVVSRELGVALLIGVAAAALTGRRLARVAPSGPLLAAAACAAIVTPSIAWQAAHHWETVRFALQGRHVIGSWSMARLISLLGTFAAACSPGIAALCAWGLARSCRRNAPDNFLTAWTALPLIVIASALSLREPVETYWLAGPVVSLIGFASAAVAVVRIQAWIAAVVLAPAVLETGFVLAAADAPQRLVSTALHAGGSGLKNNGPFEIFAYPAAARDLAMRTAGTGQWVLTDGYGLSSVLDFYGGVPPVVIGYDEQGRESRNWYDPGAAPASALFFDKEPLATRPDMREALARACASVTVEPDLSYEYAGEPVRTFYVTRCDGLTPGGMRFLQYMGHGP
ncbi:MAG TPA: glycosyltransferase family 39 protein, partial [Candidatus Eremiobacteraceae bacterium]|nr:glycosyltransferase family 39 protein [Candidatus Eremiobacteraceae bacterium]